MTAATSAEAVGYRLELGVPAEIVIDAAVPADAWPDPLPPVVHAAIATPMALNAKIAIPTRRILFFRCISITSITALREQGSRTRQSPHRYARPSPPAPKGGVAAAKEG